MKLVEVFGGHFAKVDDEDFERVSAMKWHIMKGRKTVYAATNAKRPNGGYSTMSMHRMINETPTGFDTDHIDGDGLNNTKANLRTATRTQNSQNRSANQNAASPYKGVHWNKRKRRWVASIRVNKSLIFLGLHKSETDAAAAYDLAAVEHFGEFARTTGGATQ